jgi:hypothetical protein
MSALGGRAKTGYRYTRSADGLELCQEQEERKKEGKAQTLHGEMLILIPSPFFTPDRPSKCYMTSDFLCRRKKGVE